MCVRACVRACARVFVCVCVCVCVLLLRLSYVLLYRFGPGMVIYWFGYQKEIDVHAEDGIIICSTFMP